MKEITITKKQYNDAVALAIKKMLDDERITKDPMMSFILPSIGMMFACEIEKTLFKEETGGDE